MEMTNADSIGVLVLNEATDNAEQRTLAARADRVLEQDGTLPIACPRSSKGSA
ncbi:hypothetical protein GCM10022254_37750 [Actinomadura meridiana]|uniref:Uncharacterized protein n=1 Tax=Actinomadura meridiana TaxID=559626 RepID=A0ABP8C5B7_9ACTN